MAQVEVEAPYYSVESIESSHWTPAQEKSLAVDYPFDLHDESPEQFVTRTYLQFLWLPHTIMPLELFVPSLRRVVALPSSSQASHSLHSLLDPLLQTTRAISNKYHVELVQILRDGGGNGEIEETVMWYTLHHEKMGGHEQTGREAGVQEPWTNEKWRQDWLERLERREVQIQILLYMTKLSLPGPPPIISQLQPKRRKRPRKEADPPQPIPRERLEGFMDKLSMLQLAGHLGTNGPKLNHNEKDWAQVFCEDVVDTTFKTQLPELCSLLRSKVFPDSPFSDDDTVTASRSPSPEPTENSQVDPPAPPPVPEPTFVTSKVDSRSLARARSRSLSVSLAQDRERSVSIGPNKKRLLNREVSMSRGFKPRTKTTSKILEALSGAQQPTAPPGGLKSEKTEIILAEDTPQKPRAVVRNAASQSQSQSHFDTAASSSSTNLFGVRQSTQDLFGSRIGETDDDDEWMVDSSPDVLLLHPGRKGVGNSDDEYEAVTFHTPSKKPRRQRES